MDREEATELIKEMSRVCGIDLAKASLVIMPPNSEGIPSKGNQLHVTAELNFGSRDCLYAIIEQHKLKFKETPEKIIILEPQT